MNELNLLYLLIGFLVGRYVKMFLTVLAVKLLTTERKTKAPLNDSRKTFKERIEEAMKKEREKEHEL